MKRRGFTIIELMMVIGIIAILLGIVVSSVTGSIRRGREQRASALFALAKQGMHTYYATDKNGEWPWGSADSLSSAQVLEDGYIALSEAEVKRSFYNMIKRAKVEHNPVMDISGLFVSTQSGEPGTKGMGLGFLDAVKGTKAHPTKLKVSQMQFGYQRTDDGYFRRFVVKYSPALDSVIVRGWGSREEDRKQVLSEHEKDY